MFEALKNAPLVRLWLFQATQPIQNELLDMESYVSVAQKLTKLQKIVAGGGNVEQNGRFGNGAVYSR